MKVTRLAKAGCVCRLAQLSSRNRCRADQEGQRDPINAPRSEFDSRSAALGDTIRMLAERPGDRRPSVRSPATNDPRTVPYFDCGEAGLSQQGFGLHAGGIGIRRFDHDNRSNVIAMIDEIASVRNKRRHGAYSPFKLQRPGQTPRPEKSFPPWAVYCASVCATSQSIHPPLIFAVSTHRR
jgi:hypothetical protein